MVPHSWQLHPHPELHPPPQQPSGEAQGDPGMNRGLLLESLKKEDLSISDINYVIITHYHLDHSLLAGIFENAKILDDESIYSWDSRIEEYDKKIQREKFDTTYMMMKSFSPEAGRRFLLENWEIGSGRYTDIKFNDKVTDLGLLKKYYNAADFSNKGVR